MINWHMRIPLALFLLRVGVFIVMLLWTVDKFVAPGHASGVYEGFYLISIPEVWVMYAIGAIELLIVLGFIAGFKKRFTYGAVLLFHAISTLSSFAMYLAPFEHRLFFTAWPMLAACFALYYLRGLDTIMTVDRAGNAQ